MTTMPDMVDEDKDSFFDEKRLYKVVGINAERARQIAGLSRKEAQQKIWRYKNPDMHPNRISELETGNKKIDLKTFYRISVEYGCSPDYLLGLSDEFERNTAASYTGMVFNSVRGSVLEATDRICQQMSQVVRYLPPFQGELLRSSSRNMLDAIDRYSQDLAFRAGYPELIAQASELREAIQSFDMYLSKQMRIIELNMMDQIHHRDDEMSNRNMTEYEDVPRSEKC